jgi:hypothetical protein
MATHLKRNILLIITAALVLLVLISYLVVFFRSPSDSFLFPAQKEPANCYMEASAHGWLFIDNDCLRLKPVWFLGKGYLLIWPHGYSAEVIDGKLHVLDESGEPVAKVGDRVTIGGGEVPKAFAEELVGTEFPDSAVGNYFVTSGIGADN